MYQEELFTRTLKTQGTLGSGCFGTVSIINDEWVVKYARKDGTLNYLEWCQMMQRAGRGMPGMPEVELIVHLPDNRYMVTMRRYSDTLKERLGCFAWGEERDKVVKERWFLALRAAYLQHADEMLGPIMPRYKTARFEDTHGENIMWDQRSGSWVLTDPCSCDYSEPSNKFPMLAYVEEPEPRRLTEPDNAVAAPAELAAYQCSDPQCLVCMGMRALPAAEAPIPAKAMNKLFNERFAFDPPYRSIARRNGAYQ
jgi:hypothetical protein